MSSLRKRLPRRFSVGAAVTALALTAAIAAPTLALAGGFRTGLADPAFDNPDPGQRHTAFKRAHKAHASIARIDVSWRGSSPSSRPAHHKRNPATYDFSRIDAAVHGAKKKGLAPLLTIRDAPAWAEGANRPSDVAAGTWKPNPRLLGDFAHAIAKHYRHKVRYYQAWNEPNLFTFLNPQYKGKKLVAAHRYKRMLNSFYAGVKSAKRKAKVITAGTAPFGDPPGGRRSHPLAFQRELLCLHGRSKLKPVKCKHKAKFDAFAHNPINTSGGPHRKALNPDDAATGDIGSVKRILRRAEHKHRTGTRGHHQLWLTEFWWETKPPDKCTGVRPHTQARYIRSALHLFKRKGVSVAINYLVTDQPYESSQCGRASYQTGLFYADGKRKPSFKTFRSAG